MMKDYLTQESSSIKEFLLGVGIAFSVATTLRLDGLPVGVGEVLLLLWLVVAWSTNNKPQTRNNIYFFTVGVIGVSILMLLLGTAYNYVYEYSAFSVRTSLAYVFSWGLLWILVQQRELDVSKVFGWVVAGFILSVIIATYVGPIHGGRHIDILWTDNSPAKYWENLSENRNQFALLVLIIPFIALVFSTSKGTLLLKPVPVVLVALVLAVLVRSDALWVGWLVGGGATVLLAFKRGRAAANCERSSLLLGGVLLLSAVCFIAAKLWFVSVASGSQSTDTVITESITESISDKEAREVGGRIKLLKNGLDAIALSPMVGLGPGFYSGVNGPLEEREAHNTLIDWATQTGLIGSVALLIYWLWILVYAVRSGEAILVGLIVALGVFASFHYTLRHPLFWLVPTLVVLHSSRLRGGAAIMASSRGVGENGIA